MDAPRNRLDEPVFPIRTVAELTGIASGTLRAWERRYGFVQPERSASGHRLYSRRDIQRLRNAQLLVDGGVSLGRVGNLLDDDDICDALPDDVARWPRLAGELIRTLDSFDAAALEEVLRQGLLIAPPEDAGRHFMTPVLHDLALRWRLNRRVA
ncbi:MAG: MerR family transcriptional regulator, partial [Gammaproteobacteria bacterium]